MDTGEKYLTPSSWKIVGKNYPEIKMRNRKMLLFIRALMFWNAF